MELLTIRCAVRAGLLHASGPGGGGQAPAEEAGRVLRPRAARPQIQRSAFARFRFPPEVITVAVRWYLRHGLSYRDIEGPTQQRLGKSIECGVDTREADGARHHRVASTLPSASM
jgi:hypothetical protein